MMQKITIRKVAVTIKGPSIPTTLYNTKSMLVWVEIERATAIDI